MNSLVCCTADLLTLKLVLLQEHAVNICCSWSVEVQIDNFSLGFIYSDCLIALGVVLLHLRNLFFAFLL